MSLYNSSFNKPIVINFSSKDRISGSNSNFFSTPTDLGINKFDSVCMVAANIPKSYYNMPSGRNIIYVDEPGNPARTLTIPAGNYTKNNLVTTLNTVLNTGAPVGWVYTVTYPVATVVDSFKLTFTVTGNGGTQPIFVILEASSPFRQLGFEPDSTNPFVADSLQSTNAINLQFILRMFIKSNIVKDATDGILEEILSPGTIVSQGVIYFQQYNYDMNTRAYNSFAVNSWSFQLVDGFNQQVDLNGVPWSFSLVFYQRNDTHEIHRQELQIQNEERLIKLEQQQRELEQKFVKKDEEKEPETEPVSNTFGSASGIQTSYVLGNYVNEPPNQIYPIVPGTLVPKGLFPTSYLEQEIVTQSEEIETEEQK